jgi:hypothetical protein
LKTPILAQRAALHAVSNNENLTALAFSTAELSVIVGLYDILKFFHTPSTFRTGNENEDGGFFYPVWCD